MYYVLSYRPVCTKLPPRLLSSLRCLWYVACGTLELHRARGRLCPYQHRVQSILRRPRVHRLQVVTTQILSLKYYSNVATIIAISQLSLQNRYYHFQSVIPPPLLCMRCIAIAITPYINRNFNPLFISCAYFDCCIAIDFPTKELFNSQGMMLQMK